MPAPDEEVEGFLDEVNEVARLVEGLKAGTITPDYIDRKQEVKQQQERAWEEAAQRAKRAAAAARGPPNRSDTAGPDAASQKDNRDEAAHDVKDEQEARREAAMVKVKEIVANRERKLRARVRYEEYVASQDKEKFGTDYTKWDIWCPDDEEDDLINSMPPNTAEFRVLEKDIDERHRKMVEARQIAERCRVAGNDAFKEKQNSEALRWYQQGIESERTNMILHANAAQAALKLQCYVQAVEHCDKVISIADFLHNNLKHPMCVKAYQRRATAYGALQQPRRAVEDLEAALQIEPANAELAKQLEQARLDYNEHKKQKQISKALGKGSADGAALALDLAKLGQLERLAAVLAQGAADVEAAHGSPGDDRFGTSAVVPGGRQDQDASAARAALPASCSRGPTLPPRKCAGAAEGGHADEAPGAASSSSRAAQLTDACKQLKAMIQHDDACCVHLRQCGGLQHIASQLVRPEAAVSQARTVRAALVALLNDACMNDGNLKQLPRLNVLRQCVGFVGDADAELAAVAANLLCTATTQEDVRKEVSKLLASEHDLTRLLQLLQGGSPAVQALALALLGNCMVDKGPKAAMAALWRDARAAACFASLIRSPDHTVAERAVVMIGNMCHDSTLRQTMGSHEQLMAGLLQLLTEKARGPESLQLAAATTLYNLVMDPEGQRAVAAQPEQLAGVNKLLNSANSALQARAAGIIARVAKLAEGAAQLRALGCLAQGLKMCEVALERRACSEPSADALLDASTRLLTLATAGDDPAFAAQLVANGGVGTLLRVVQASGLSESVLGNAALCLAGVARCKEHLPALRDVDAVASLVGVAYNGKGNVASKNAAIALARMAHDPAMLERLRELHGVEIIYQYVKP